MKKSVFVLLVLLIVLIVTCVYQKTYAIYSTSPKEITLIERNSTTQSESTKKAVAVEKKEEKTSTLPNISVPTPTKPVEVKPVLAHKPVLKTEKVVEKEAKEQASPSTTNSTPAPKMPTVLKKEVRVPKPVVTEHSKTESTNKTEPVTQHTDEKEIVDYLMWALKNRDIALKNRDEVEARIQELITKALNDRKVVLDERKIVLDERSKNEVELEKLQVKLIDARDVSYESVINPKTTNQGEK